jgi:hypothetical protein
LQAKKSGHTFAIDSTEGGGDGGGAPVAVVHQYFVNPLMAAMLLARLTAGAGSGSGSAVASAVGLEELLALAYPDVRRDRRRHLAQDAVAAAAAGAPLALAYGVEEL